ncbi:MULTISPECIES: hypothetical protein [Mycobacterium avium complex (MAC)]|uniref:hypothetical protein n=1 Tax=Mycobacterium avium complex (MAC) TaxID=120793 RepID=UPI0004526EE4|nr:hypothetical protein [Mycobacterium intracellulare]ETZ39933.1 hypothetical protein L843_0222 [Mycobacterium intracellulare MIN_061107_1834]MCA2273496.1 hypothetical protein [Mycobacterium intracellulare]MCA2326064.1 hypothetical protein [Mycobacterium intracellulare]UEB24790.1 hypothetical protein LK403_00610 [Mycobacterium intracellulare]BCO60203.1 hypothetical protein MINTM006_01530 [Mycobacterium intracellulare]
MSITEHEIGTASSETDDDDHTELNAATDIDSEVAASDTKPASDNSDDDAEPAADTASKTGPNIRAKTPKSTRPVTDNTPDDDSAEEPTKRQISVPVRTLVMSAVIGVVVAGFATLGWLYLGAENKLSAQSRAAADGKHAQEIAVDYAVHAAEMNFQDLNKWKTDLVRHTSPELKEKLTKAAGDMEQILVPLQWNSTAKPLAAIVRSDAGGTYTVDAFISVLTKTVQAPQGLQSTATYSLTIDRNKDWQISDVGGIDAALGAK